MRAQLGVLLVAAVTGLSVAAPAGAASQTVLIGSSFYDPQTVVVTAGDSVTWTNGSGRHTVTSDAGAFDSGPLAEGQSFSYQFNQPGTYAYSDRLHPGGARGTVIVQALDNVPPSASLQVSPTSATAGTAITFDASGSRDPDGALTHFRWDFDGDGSYETDTGPTSQVSRSFPRAGTYRVGLIVEDDRGSSAVAQPVTLTVLPPAKQDDTTPPDLSVLSIRGRALKPGERPRVRIAVGASATLRVRVQRLRRGGHRPDMVKQFRRRVRPGTQLLRYTPGRLRPARYRLSIVAVDRAGNRSARVLTEFRVAKPKKKDGAGTKGADAGT
jgi:plastocyanin